MKKIKQPAYRAVGLANEEIERVLNNPYYFAMTYLKIKTITGKLVPYSTSFTEDEFNRYFLQCRPKEAKYKKLLSRVKTLKQKH